MKYSLRNNLLCSAGAAYVLALICNLLIYQNDPLSVSCSGLVSLFWLAVLFFIAFAGYAVCFRILQKIYTQFLVYPLLIYILLSIFFVLNNNPYYAFVCALLLSLIILKVHMPRFPWNFGQKRLFAGTAMLFLLVVGVVSAGTILRYVAYGSSNYDLGIFLQMFENMAKTGIQYTTVERNELMSHFQVHFSPIFYLLLPAYLVFRTPESLLVMQALVVYSGVFPLLLLCKRFGLGTKQSFLAAAVFLFYPAFATANFYDIHENMFLTPLILWLFWFMDEHKRVGTAVTAILLLCIKEDAGLYLIIIALYELFHMKKKLLPALTLGGGVVGFVCSNRFIEQFGEGVKVDRYSVYLQAGQDSLTDVMQNVIKNPAFFLSHLLSAEKLVFVIFLFAPLMFLPFFSRKLYDFVLFIPVAVVNLATTYPYQYSIYYQYVFGSGAMLIYLFIKNLPLIKARQNKILLAGACTSCILVSTALSDSYQIYAERYTVQKDLIAESDEALQSLDTNANILADTYMIPKLYQCESVYNFDLARPAGMEFRYVVLDGTASDLNDKLVTYWAEGYEVVKSTYFAVVLEKPANE